jgi:YD repeat-containing protein
MTPGESIVQFEDGLQHVTNYAYDALARLTQATDPLSQVTAQTFDRNGNRAGLINALGNATTFTFDQGDRITSVTTASGLITSYSYNANNTVATVTKPSGQQVQNSYDKAARLIQQTDSSASTGFAYDKNSQLIQATDNAGGQNRQIAKSYDPLNRLASYTDEAGNTIGYIYDPAGNLIQITYPDGRSVNYGYDQNNRLSSVTDWAGRVTTYQYDNNGRLILTSRPDGTQEKRAYDGSGMLISINDTAPWGTIYADSITIDAAGRTTAENETTPVQPFTLPAAFSATCDADNRISTVNGTAVTFDADGNMLSGPAPGTLTNTGYSYNARNQLIEAGGFAYTYRVLGNRIAVRSPLNAYTTFVVDPNAPLDRVLSRTVSGPTGVSTTYYVYGLGLIGEETAGVYTAYHFDPRGSTVALTDINANVTDSFSYGPYGELNNHTGFSTTPFQYNGQFGVQTDSNGLLYMYPNIIVIGIAVLSVGLVGLKGIMDVYKRTGQWNFARAPAAVATLILLGIGVIFVGLTGLGLVREDPAHRQKVGEQPAVTSPETPRGSVSANRADGGGLDK